MKWHHCIDSAQKLALELCHGSMNKGYGIGDGELRDDRGGDYGCSDGDGGGGDYDGDYGYGYGDGDGGSPERWFASGEALAPWELF